MILCQKMAGNTPYSSILVYGRRNRAKPKCARRRFMFEKPWARAENATAKRDFGRFLT